MMLVRLIPYNPKTGHTLKTFTYAGVQFRAEGAQVGTTDIPGKSWYSVPDEVANYLKDVHVDDDPNGPKAFDVKTYEEAKAFEEANGRKIDARTTAEYIRLGGDVSSADLGAGARGARVITGRGEANPEDRPGSASSLTGDPNRTHATDPAPAPARTGDAPNDASALGTPSNPIEAGGGKPAEASGAPAKPAGRSR